MSAAQDFGEAVKLCRNPVSHMVLATRMLSIPDFVLPFVSRPADLEIHLAHIEAGHKWPYTLEDLNPFMRAVQQSLPQRSTFADTSLRITAAAYFHYLSRHHR